MKIDDCMDKKRVIVEEWKAGRKEWKKKRWKKGKREKSGFWEKSFLFLFDCVFASCLFFLMHPSRPHHNTRPHSTHHTIQHGTLVHTVTCKQGRVLVLQRTHGPFQQSCDDVILFFAIRGFYDPIAFSLTSPDFFNLQFEEKTLFCN